MSAGETPRAEETPRCPACDDTTVCGHDYHWGSVNAEITALRQQVKELQDRLDASRDKVKTRDEQIAQLEQQIEETRTKQLWADSYSRGDAQALREALERAIEVIRTWHGMGMPVVLEAAAWTLYQESPEMKAIRAALTAHSSTKKDQP